MNYSLEPYQEEFVSKITEKLEQHQSIIAQLPTGGGKTVILAALTKQFINSKDKDVIIFVHRMELLQQTVKALLKWDIDKKNVGTIDSETTGYLHVKRVYIAMIETFYRRMKDPKEIRLHERMKNVGLVIVDEAHRMEYKKMFSHFKNTPRIGFTATPMAATIKDPLKNYYDDIVSGYSIKELIEVNKKNAQRGVVPDVTYILENVNRNDLITKGEDYDPDLMGIEFSKMRQVQNTIDAYTNYALGKKMLCFNVNIEHSKKVTEEMCKQGLKAKHLDGNHSIEEREKIFDWLKNTPNAILCNVGIATTGFDEPSIEGVIINKATKSLTLYKQMCGRSARPYRYPEDGRFKTEHIILDMGDNAGDHGVWSEEIDWEYHFLHPHIPKSGIAPLKTCPKCYCGNATSARICKGIVNQKECGYEFIFHSAIEDTSKRDMIRITVNVKNIIKLFEDRNEYFSFLEIIKEIARQKRDIAIDNNITQSAFDDLCELAHSKIEEWINLVGKIEVEPYKKATRNTLLSELNLLRFSISNDNINNMRNSLQMKINQAKREHDKAVDTRSPSERIEELRDRLYKAQDDLKEYEDSLVSREQKEAFSSFEALQIQKDKLHSDIVDLQDRLESLNNELEEAEIKARLAWPEKFLQNTKGSLSAAKKKTSVRDDGGKPFLGKLNSKEEDEIKIDMAIKAAIAENKSTGETAILRTVYPGDYTMSDSPVKLKRHQFYKKYAKLNNVWTGKN